jgi:hypothetical protein
MSFLEKKDYCALAKDGALVVKSVTVGTSAGVNETTNKKGEIVNEHVYGEIDAPDCSYAITGEWRLSGIKLGAISEIDGKKFALASIVINTSVAEPQISATAVQVEDAAVVGGGSWIVPEITVTPLHEVQVLADAFTIEGDGNYEQSANYTISATVATHTKDGKPVGHSSSRGKIVCALTITQIGDTAPVVTPGEGWLITSPLALTNNDSAEPSWTCQLTLPLVKAV